MEEYKKFVVRVRGIIIHDGKLLVVKHSHDTSFCALPGGHIEWQEDIEQGLSREIIEELGVVPQIGRLLYINNFMDGDIRQSVEFFFEITNGKDYFNTDHLEKTHAYEIAEVCWIDTTDSMNLKPDALWQDFKAGKIFSDQVKFLNINES